MYTQCPHCQTLFRISAEQLKAAAGKAHCCRCDQVFSALDNLREPEPDEAWPESRLIDDLPQQQNLELPFEIPDRDGEPEEDEQGVSDLLQNLQFKAEPETPPVDEESDFSPLAEDDQRDPFEPIYDLSDTGMDSVQIGLDSRLHDLPEESLSGEPPAPETLDMETLDPDTEPGRVEPEEPGPEDVPPVAAEPLSQPPTPPPFPIPDNLPALEPTEKEPLAPEEALASAAEERRGIAVWSLVILLLLLLAGAQLAWFGRDHLIRYPAGRALLEYACELLPCNLPARHSPRDIEVVSRSISSHPERDDALLVMLTLRNRAPFEQAYPTLELSLLDSRSDVVARRSFSPATYRGDDRALLQPGVPVSLRLELSDPGEEVVGFRFDFY